MVFYLWGPMHEQYLWAGLLSLLIVVLPVASIAGERVLPSSWRSSPASGESSPSSCW
ncbi:MAG: hypothetical protein M5U28_33925 [Sandaracinaceae bacterium]|nr:hypothetical protein [Sandaracinaceae bacterium]